jgi:hypothetical protein
LSSTEAHKQFYEFILQKSFADMNLAVNPSAA